MGPDGNAVFFKRSRSSQLKVKAFQGLICEGFKQCLSFTSVINVASIVITIIAIVIMIALIVNVVIDI